MKSYQGVAIVNNPTHINGVRGPVCIYFDPESRGSYDHAASTGTLEDGRPVLDHIWLEEPVEWPEIHTKAREMLDKFKHMFR